MINIGDSMKVLRFIKANLLVSISMLLVIAGIGVYATTGNTNTVLPSSEVSYNDTTVHAAITDLYSKVGSGGKVATGYIDGGSEAQKITTGFKPKYLCLMNITSTTSMRALVYIEDVSTTKTFYANMNATDDTRITSTALPTTTSVRINSIDDDGFTLGKIGSWKLYWFAVG